MIFTSHILGHLVVRMSRKHNGHPFMSESRFTHWCLSLLELDPGRLINSYNVILKAIHHSLVSQ